MQNIHVDQLRFIICCCSVGMEVLFSIPYKQNLATFHQHRMNLCTLFLASA